MDTTDELPQTQPTEQTEPIEKKAVRKPRAPSKKQPNQDIKLLVPSIVPAPKAVRRYAKLDEEQLSQKLAAITQRLSLAEEKYIRALKEQIAIKAALLLKNEPKGEKEVHTSNLDVVNLFILPFLAMWALVYLIIRVNVYTDI
jgi:hypothetical protein